MNTRRGFFGFVAGAVGLLPFVNAKAGKPKRRKCETTFVDRSRYEVGEHGYEPTGISEETDNLTEILHRGGRLVIEEYNGGMGVRCFIYGEQYGKAVPISKYNLCHMINVFVEQNLPEILAERAKQ